MKKLGFSLLAVAGALLLLVRGAGIASAQTIYTAGADNSFGSFNLATRQYTRVSLTLGGVNTYNLTSNGAGGLFGTQNSGVGNDTFVRITTGGAVTQIGALQGMDDVIYGLSRATNGTLYGYGGNASTVGTVNPATGVYTSTGPAGFAATTVFGGDLAFSASTLYAASSDNGGGLHSVNTATGAFSAQIGASNALYSGGVLFNSAGNLYLLNGTNLYADNTSTGVLTLLGALTGTNLPTSFNAAATVVPEPSTWALLGLGAVGAGVVVLRRRRAV